MTSSQLPAPKARALTYLVERYLPATAMDDLGPSVARLAGICGETGTHGVRYLHSTYLPSEDTCFCVFEAPSQAAVRAVNHEAHFALDRITKAVPMFPNTPQETS